MANPAGVAGQIGWKSEAVWGTFLTPTVFYPGLRSEGVKNNGGARIPSQGIRAGRTVTAQHARGVPIIGGPLTMEMGNNSIAVLLKHCFGAVSTTGSGPYTHTYTPGDISQYSFGCQVGRPNTAGTVVPFSWAGCRVPSWELTASAGEIAMINPTISAKSETTGTALATASYSATWAPFSYSAGAVTVGGNSVSVDSFSLKANNNLRTDRAVIGSTNAITPQLPNGLRGLTLDLTMDWESTTQYAAFLADTAQTVVISLTSGAESFTVTAKGFLTGESPNIAGPEILKQPITFEIESSVSDADAFSAVLVSAADASAA